MLTSDTNMYSLLKYNISQLLYILQELFDVIVLHNGVLECPFSSYYINDSCQLSYSMTVYIVITAFCNVLLL